MDDDTVNKDHDGTVDHSDDKLEDLSRHEASLTTHGEQRLVVRSASVHVRLVGTPARAAGTPLTDQSPLEWLGLNSRTLNCLMRAGLRRVSDVTSLTKKQPLALRNFSTECLTDLRDHLRDVPE